LHVFTRAALLLICRFCDVGLLLGALLVRHVGSPFDRSLCLIPFGGETVDITHHLANNQSCRALSALRCHAEFRCEAMPNASSILQRGDGWASGAPLSSPRAMAGELGRSRTGPPNPCVPAPPREATTSTDGT